MPPLKLKIGDVVWLNKSKNREYIDHYVEPITGPGPFIATTRTLYGNDSVRIKRADGKLFPPSKWDWRSKPQEEYAIYAGYVRKDEFLTAVKRARKPKKTKGPAREGAD